MTKFAHLILASALLALAANLGAAAQSASTVWSGVYNADQAVKGKATYGEYCAGCHMDDLSGGGPAPALTGAAFLVQNEKRSVGELLTRIKTTMPPDQPDQLGDETYLQVVAYLLQQAGFPEGQAPLPTRIDLLNQIKITPKKAGHE